MPVTPPVNFATLRQGIINAASYATGLTTGQIILQEPTVPNSPRPPKPFMGIKPYTLTPRGWDSGSIVADNTGALSYRSVGQRSMAVSCHTYADSQDDAHALMASWQAGLSFPCVQEMLRAAGLAVWDVGEVRDLSTALETAFEGRAQMDVLCGVASIASYANPDIIESATVKITFTGPDTFNVTIGG